MHLKHCESLQMPKGFILFYFILLFYILKKFFMKNAEQRLMNIEDADKTSFTQSKTLNKHKWRKKVMVNYKPGKEVTICCFFLQKIN